MRKNCKMEKIQIAYEEMKSSFTLKYFFKDEFKTKDNIYIIPTNHILYISRKPFPIINKEIGIVCENDILCRCHKFKKYIEEIVKFLQDSLEIDGIFYKNFEFFKDDESNDFFGWSHVPGDHKNLKHLSYSRRLQYLN